MEDDKVANPDRRGRREADWDSCPTDDTAAVDQRCRQSGQSTEAAVVVLNRRLLLSLRIAIIAIVKVHFRFKC